MCKRAGIKVYDLLVCVCCCERMGAQATLAQPRNMCGVSQYTTPVSCHSAVSLNTY